MLLVPVVMPSRARGDFYASPDASAHRETPDRKRSWLIGVVRLIRCTVGPLINHKARINHVKGRDYRTGERIFIPPRRLRTPAGAVSTGSVCSSGRIGA